MMKKRIATQILSLLLVSVVSLGCFACNKGEDDVTEPPTEETTPEVTTTRNVYVPPIEPDPTGTIKISVTNGTLDNGKSEGKYEVGDEITLTAANPAKGYRFTHWENAKGETVGTEKTLTATVSATESYKAYYEVFFGSAGEQILSDLDNDWMQGAFDGDFKSFTGPSNLTRVAFKEPYLLRAGETMSVKLPTVQCCVNPGDCPKLDGTGDCTLITAFVTMKKNPNSNTGDITKDYSIVKGHWAGTMTPTEDTYVMVMIKWSKHGGEQFLLTSDYMKQVKIMISKPATSTDGVPVGGYWTEELEDSVTKIEANREAIGEGVSEFFYLTDSHWIGNAQYSPALVNYLAEKLNARHMVFGGDLIHKYNPNKEKAINLEVNSFYNALTSYTKAGESLRIMTTLGNHDRNYASNNTNRALRFSEKEAYELYMKRMEGWGVTVEDDPNVSYYDDTANKVRYIQFFFTDSRFNMPEDSNVDRAMAWAEEQIKALDADWTVVLFTHGFYTGEKGSDLEFTEKTKEVANRMLTLQKEAAAEIAAWIVGHNHQDRNEVLMSEDGNTKLRVISCSSDGYLSQANTAKEQSFSFFQLDTVNKKLYMTRIGAGDDAVFTYGQDIEGTLTFQSTSTPTGDISISVTNGTLGNGKSEWKYNAGDTITLSAAIPAKGYRFTHWENAKGETVGTEKELTLTVSAEESYKAYYEVYFGSDGGNQVLTDIENDWMQGAFDGSFQGFTGPSNLTRVTFKEPFFVKAGETLSITLPDVKCCITPGACPKLNNSGDCDLIAGLVILEKIESSNTGDVTKDYQIVSGSWKSSITPTKDTYVMIMIKWNKHGSEQFLLSNDYMKEVKVVHETLSATGDAKPVGGYWHTELDSAISKIEANREAIGAGVSEFFFLTDVHWLNNAQYSPALINYLSEKLHNQNVVFGGDVVEYHNDTREGAIEEEIKPFFHALTGYTKAGEALKVMTTVGNHDRNRADAEAQTGIHISEADVYELYVKRVEEFGQTTPGNPNRCCFDDTENKVRYIQFYLVDNKYNVATNAFTKEALDWTEERIMELDEDWTVVLFTHGYRRYNSDTGELDLFEKNIEYKNRILKIKEAAKADIACWIVGHAHINYTEELSSDETDETLRLIALSSDSYSNNRDHKYNTDTAEKMVLGTATEQSFSYFQIDTVNKKIYITRIGAGADLVYSFG